MSGVARSACVATANWVPSQQQSGQYPTPKISVSKDEQGSYDQVLPTGWTRVSIKDIVGYKIGWVPTNVVRFGLPIITPLPIKTPTVNPAPAPAPAPLEIDDVYLKALKQLWNRIKARPELAVRQADRSNENITKVLFGPGVDHYAQIIYRNTVPEAMPMLTTGRFDPRELSRQMRPVDETAHHINRVFGIYLYLFEDIPTNYTKWDTSNQARDSLYIGQTLDFPDRQNGHEAYFTKPRPEGDSNLYQVGRRAARKKMTPLVVFRHDDPLIAQLGKSIIIEATELTFVCLFQSWFPRLYKEQPAQGAGGQIKVPYEYAAKYFGLVNQIKAQTG